MITITMTRSLPFSLTVLLLAAWLPAARAQSLVSVCNQDPPYDQDTCATNVDPGAGVTLSGWGSYVKISVNGGPTVNVLGEEYTVYGLPFDQWISIQWRPLWRENWDAPFSCGFTTIAPTAPANDEECTAEVLSPGANCNPTSGTVKGASSDDVWYTFVADAGAHTSIPVEPTASTLLQATLYEGFCGGGLSALSSSTSFATGEPARINVSGLNQGQTYYVQVAAASVDSRSAEFTICVIEDSQLFDCLGVAGGSALTGSPCDDGNACTTNDVWGAGCACAGVSTDTDGDGTCNIFDKCPGNPEPATQCDDGDPCTYADMWGWNCLCAGLILDSDGDGTPDCQDECPGDENKVLIGQCGCFNLDTDTDNDGVADCQDQLPTIFGTVGTPCDDINPNTFDDSYNYLGQCEGGVPPLIGLDTLDCLGVAGGYNLPGLECETYIPDAFGGYIMDYGTWGPNCTCRVVADNPDGDVYWGGYDGCPDQPTTDPPGTTGVCSYRCILINGDDGDLNNCECVPKECSQNALARDHDVDLDSIWRPWIALGPFDECQFAYGSIGSPCQDGDPFTINDVLTATCECVGVQADFDCLGVLDGTALPGTGCDDGLTWTYDDQWTNDCQCAGDFSTQVDRANGTGAAFSLQPNPARAGAVVLSSTSVWTKALIEVVDAAGRVAHTQRAASITSSITLDLGDLDAGTYTVRLSAAEGIASQRITIQR